MAAYGVKGGASQFKKFSRRTTAKEKKKTQFTYTFHALSLT